MIFGDLYKTEQEISPIKIIVSMKVCVKLVFMIISINTLVIYFLIVYH